MSDLFEDVRKHVEETVRELKGGDDFMPTLVVKDHKDQVLAVGMVWPDDASSSGKDMVAASMAAVCCLHRAKEAAFTSVAWMVRPNPGDPWPDKPPSECADRQEIVMVSAMSADGSGTLFTAPMVRENNLCGVGVWDQSMPQMVSTGRFAEALRHGMQMGANIPVDMAAYIDSEIEAGREGKMVAIFTRLYADQAAQAYERAAREAKAREN